MTRAAVVGLGAIGGSVALAAAARGFDRDGGVRDRARRRGIDTRETLDEAVAGAEFVVTAVPTSETPGLLARIAALAPRALLTDCASLKRPVVAAAASLPPGAHFVAGHPMAGPKGDGVEAADPGIFRGRPWALVRTERTDDAGAAEAEAFVRSLGARPVWLDAERHDRAMTWVSHAPLAVSAALARAASRAGGADLAALAGPGLLGATRLAGQAPALAMELALADSDALASAADAVAADLAELSAALKRADARAVRAFFEEAAALRRSLEP